MTPREFIACAAGVLLGIVLANLQQWRRDNAARELQRRVDEYRRDTESAADYRAAHLEPLPPASDAVDNVTRLRDRQGVARIVQLQAWRRG